MNIRAHNRKAWDKRVADGDVWTRPVDSEAIRRARQGDVQILLTPTKHVPASWFPDLDGLRTLCLASGGGQQGPLLAAAGGEVTVFDNSPKQLTQDRLVGDREGLAIETIEGDMADLSQFGDGLFGLIVHPCSNCYVPDVLPVWRECFRVLASGGLLMTGFCNPVRYIFEDSRHDNGVLLVRYVIPHSDADEVADPPLRRRILQDSEAFEFGHTLTNQIGGQLQAGLVLTDLYEDRYEGADNDPISKYIDTFIATRAIKP
jgi:SAM-dependent methyltransferase